jgi:hypothetical protein
MPQEPEVAEETELVSPEVESLAEARSEVNSRIPPGQCVLSERVISDGKPIAIHGTGDTIEAAYAEAERQVPEGAAVVSRKEIQARSRRTVTAPAPDETVARGLMYGQLGQKEHIDTVVQIAPGKPGFLGIGRKLPEWQAEAWAAAEVEVSYRRPAQLAVRVGTRPESWEGLLNALNALGGAQDSAVAHRLEAALPYQCMFVLLSGKLGQPGYFTPIPFTPVNEKMVAAARRYVDNTRLPGMLGITGGSLDPSRYRVGAGGGVGKIASANTLVADSSIATTSACVPRRNIPMTDFAEIGKVAFNAVTHYAEIPVVRYCFSLPYIAGVLESRKIDMNQALITIYKGVESLLLEIWDELPDGGHITDEGVERKARGILSAA